MYWQDISKTDLQMYYNSILLFRGRHINAHHMDTKNLNFLSVSDDKQSFPITEYPFFKKNPLLWPGILYVICWQTVHYLAKNTDKPQKLFLYRGVEDWLHFWLISWLIDISGSLS